jgi:hypothetical protein
MNPLSAAELERLAAAIEHAAPADTRPGGPENLAAACVLLDQMAAEHEGQAIGDAATRISGRLALTIDHSLRARLIREAKAALPT